MNAPMIRINVVALVDMFFDKRRIKINALDANQICVSVEMFKVANLKWQ